jgi:hypothetical protein
MVASDFSEGAILVQLSLASKCPGEVTLFKRTVRGRWAREKDTVLPSFAFEFNFFAVH